MRHMWTLFEPIHDVTYFHPAARAAFEEAGLRGFWRGYFAGRAAPPRLPVARPAEGNGSRPRAQAGRARRVGGGLAPGPRAPPPARLAPRRGAGHSRRHSPVPADRGDDRRARRRTVEWSGRRT